MQHILDTIRVIGYKYDKLKENDNFNLFTILRNSSDEVNLHSQFLFTLLNPEGNHHKGRQFLNEFLRIFEIENFDNQVVKVYKEYEGIDILIKNANRAIIIENKIWAGDQDKQLQRYYETIEGEGIKEIKIIYLSPYGKEPSEQSIGYLKDLDDFENMLLLGSYEYNIQEWLDECIKIAALHPVMRETFVQYQKLISELIGNTIIMDERNEIIELLKQNDNILQAQKIAANWVHVKWHVEWDFWNDFEALVSKEYPILTEGKYSTDLLTSAIHSKRNKYSCYGLVFDIAQTSDGDYCIWIVRETGEDVYYGLTLKHEGAIEYNETLLKVAEGIEKMSEWGHSEYWLGGNYLQPKINFETFASQETLKLINPDYRAKFLQDNWIKIKEFAEMCKNEIRKHP